MGRETHDFTPSNPRFGEDLAIFAERKAKKGRLGGKLEVVVDVGK